MKENIEKGVKLLNKPEAIIKEILQQVHAMGANDSEEWMLQSILEKLGKGLCSGDEAIQQAREIFARKQSYH